jgi:hypothetical protein
MNSESSQNNPNQPLPNLPSFSQQSSGLGSLAQSSRKKKLNETRNILIIIGILTALFNGFMFVNSENEVNEVAKNEIAKVQKQPGMMVDQKAVAEFKSKVLTMVRIIYGSLIALGVLYIIFGLIIHTYPVPISITSLVLYIGANAILGYLDPMTLASGIIWKVIVIVALIKGIQAAISYQSELNLQRSQEAFPAA